MTQEELKQQDYLYEFYCQVFLEFWLQIFDINGVSRELKVFVIVQRFAQSDYTIRCRFHAKANKRDASIG